MKTFSLAIHGGAGTIVRQQMTTEMEQAYTQALEEALDAGYTVLKNKGKATDAVIAATVCLENNILFNAGRGSVFTHNGLHEMDASLMDGSNHAAGAVAGIQQIANPILLANEVMLHSDHVFLAGQGAMEFARNRNIHFENNDYFFSEHRHQQWKAMQQTEGYALDHSVTSTAVSEKKFGTVGAVACDGYGNIAAATSTGGMTNKKFGRIGDSPIIGAGTYASNTTCAISCTGHGEPFIKAVAAHTVSCLMEYKHLSLDEAMAQVVHQKLIHMQGEGGMIGVDARANISMQFNSDGMYRAMQHSNGVQLVAIYK